MELGPIQSLTGLFREPARQGECMSSGCGVLRKHLYVGLRFARGGGKKYQILEQGWVCQHPEDQQPYHPACELLHATCLVSIS